MNGKNSAQRKGALATFLAFVDEIRQLASISTGAAVIAPIALFPLGPTWPSAPVVAALAGCIQFVTLMCAFEYFNSRRKMSNRVLESVLYVAVPVWTLLVVAYFWLWSAFVCYSQAEKSNVTVGWEYVVPEGVDASVAMEVRGNKSMQELLDSVGGLRSRMWTTRSIRHMQVAILFVWVGLWSLFGIVVGAFVSRQRRRVPSQKKPGRSKAAASKGLGEKSSM